MINNTFFKAFRHLYSVILASCILLSSWNLFGQSKADTAEKWVGTWGTAPQLVEPGNVPPSPGLTNNSLRQVVRVSIGGDSLRVNFSNKFSTDSVTMKSVQIAVSTGGSTIEVSTNKELTFNGSAEVTMYPGATATSDPIFFGLEPRKSIAITIYFGQTSADITGHPGSRTTSYLKAGNNPSVIDFSSSITTDHWYIITGIDVKAPSTAYAVAVLGNSITDGRGSTTNLQNRWTDLFSEALLEDTTTQHVGVLNMGLGGNCMLSGGLGPTALSRYERDILNQPGVRCAIIFEGVNNIGGVSTAAAVTYIANNLIAAYKQIIADAHTRNLWIYGATILPFKGNGYYNPYSNMCRNKVNEWIRNSDYFDAVLDFDTVMRNPQDPSRLGVPTYQNDGLHPDTSGYRVMVESIDLKLFAFLDTLFPAIDTTGIESCWIEPECATVGDNWDKTNDAQVSNGCYVSVKPGFNSTSAAPADNAGAINIPFAVTQDTTYYVYALLNCATTDDDAFWIKLDTGSFAMIDGLSTSGWQWQKLDSFALAAGNHTLSIAYCEDGALLDKISITNDKYYTPTGMGKAADIVCLYEPPTVGVDFNETVDGYRLGQNYPNPFNDNTTIAFDIPRDTYVSLKVYSMIGEEIAELAGKEYTSGRHTVECDTKNLSQGIYFYTIKADKYSACRKMTLQEK